MSIELRENEWARDAIIRRDLGKNTYETLSRVARYYLDQGFPKQDVRRLLCIFAVQCDPEFSIAMYSDLIDGALNRAIRRPSVNIEYIRITKMELRDILELEQKQAQRLAFTLLVLAKYLDIVNPNNNHWVTFKDCDIMRMANINTSIKRQCSMYRFLNEYDLIHYSKRISNLNVQVTFVMDEDPETALKITDLRNLGYQFLSYQNDGVGYYVCENCGITEKVPTTSGRGRKRKYCLECAAKIKMKHNVNRVMRKHSRKVQLDYFDK